MTVLRFGRRMRKAAIGLATAALSCTIVATTTDTAQAYTAWPDVILIPRSNGNVCLAQDWGANVPPTWKRTTTCASEAPARSPEGCSGRCIPRHPTPATPT
ncbi:hypothetical protein GCM10020000_79110 [Streptomyces olivoverticillatus]